MIWGEMRFREIYTEDLENEMRDITLNSNDHETRCVITGET